MRAYPRLVFSAPLRGAKIRSPGGSPFVIKRIILAALGRKRKAPQSVCFAGLVYPGSYLLSRDLSSDYHRRADVSLPGSEWDRVGPSGYDHQVSGSGWASLPIWQSLLRGLFISQRQADIRVACVFVVVRLLSYLPESSGNCLSPGVLYKVCWMLVVLGSIHYCNYTCTLSTWSSSTLL